MISYGNFEAHHTTRVHTLSGRLKRCEGFSQRSRWPARQRQRNGHCRANGRSEGCDRIASSTVGEEAEYKDGPFDIAFIGMCRKAYGNLAGWQSEKSWKDGAETYAGMVEVSRALMKGKTMEEQQMAVIAGFPKVPPWFRKLFPYSKWGAELNAWITPIFFRWLVGPMERREIEVNGQTQKSLVHITKCRYLAESSCAGMCINLCKTPVQTFFTQELGMPLTMKPNFEDYSCEMVFGEMPPPAIADEAYTQPCLRECPSGRTDSPKCVKLS